jgi:predicted DNA-binding transcriptional regulator AlpA
MVRKKNGQQAVFIAQRDGSNVERRYINRKQLREIIPVSDMSIWRWERDPEVAFPAPVKLANGRNYWWLPAILDWQRTRAERQTAEASQSGSSIRSSAASPPPPRWRREGGGQ